jgi:hypothetical protein
MIPPGAFRHAPEAMMEESEKITIIEGPPPTFELTNEPWMLGLAEGIVPFGVAACRLRSFNVPELVERCYRSWRDGQTIHLEYRDEGGLTKQAPIVAVRLLDEPDGQILLLWIRVEETQIEIELDIDIADYDDEFDDDFDDDLEDSDIDPSF